MTPVKSTTNRVTRAQIKLIEGGVMSTRVESSPLHHALEASKRNKTTEAAFKSKAATCAQTIQETGPLHTIEEEQESYAFNASSPVFITHPWPEPSLLLHPPAALTPHDFEVGGTIGKGKYGRVYLARHLSTNFICALKIISKAQCISQRDETLIRRELEVHQNLFHKNILKLFSWFHDASSIYLVLEYAPGGSLYSKLKKQPKRCFDERTTAGYVAQMAGAPRRMHDKNIMHRDIKPENILLGLHDEIKFADFGYAVHSASGFRSTVCGTLDYLSPEVAIMLAQPGRSTEYYTKAIDQWSLGVLMYELLVGKPPFQMKTAEKTREMIAGFNGKGLRFSTRVSREARELVRSLLDVEAEKRLGFEDVLGHAWVRGYVERSRVSGMRSLGIMLESAV